MPQKFLSKTGEQLAEKTKQLSERLRRKEETTESLEKRLKQLQAERADLSTRRKLEKEIKESRSEIARLKAEGSVTRKVLRGTHDALQTTLHTTYKGLTGPKAKKVAKRSLKEMKKVLFG